MEIIFRCNYVRFIRKLNIKLVEKVKKKIECENDIGKEYVTSTTFSIYQFEKKCSIFKFLKNLMVFKDHHLWYYELDY